MMLTRKIHWKDDTELDQSIKFITLVNNTLKYGDENLDQ
jgi:hypothetical protein